MVDMPEVGVQVESTGLTYVRPYVGGRPSDEEVKDEPEDDMLSLVAVEGDLADRAMGTCHDTVTTAQEVRVVSAGAFLKIPVTSPKAAVDTLWLELGQRTVRSAAWKPILTEEWRLGRLLAVEALISPMPGPAQRQNLNNRAAIQRGGTEQAPKAAGAFVCPSDTTAGN
ncbi:hypothetical protein FPRO04_05034 [Fusarium proliferatum]|nr:hypothetical protein FPRO04_05034 [Fusarium proliferatum]